MDAHRAACRNQICSANLGKFPAAHLGQDDPCRRSLLARAAESPLSAWQFILFGHCGKVLPPEMDSALVELAQTQIIERVEMYHGTSPQKLCIGYSLLPHLTIWFDC